MPRYQFTCNQCQERFEVPMSVKDKETATVLCPKCESKDVSQVYSGLNIINSRSRDAGSNSGCCGGSGCCG